MLKTLLILVPTILFVLIILWAFLLGLARGLRKSVILLIQATVAFLIALIFYLIVVNNPQSDEAIVGITNTFMGQGGLQRSLGVAAENNTLTSIITELIITKVNYGEGLTLALQENANYLATLVSLAYHLVFFFIALLVYDILLFLFYLIYVIFYPERRHKAKKEAKELELNSDYKYKKRSLWGGLVGFGRGLVVALVNMSFIGAVLFMVGGGIGEKTYTTEYEFGDENKNRLYEVYEALGSYGSNGVIKVLNIAKNKNEVPYYYFAANIVLQGNLTDEKLGINEKVYFAEELGQYTRLVRDTFDLMMETDSQTVIDLINGKIKSDDDRIFAILGNQKFQEGFSQIINKFDGGKYFINFGLSMLDSIANHLDKMDFTNNMDPKTRELLLVLLKSDYYSNYIPDDQTKKNAKQAVSTLKVSHLLVKEDINVLLTPVLKLLSVSKNATDADKLKIYSENLVPALKQLSIINDANKKTELNGVLERVFVCVDNMYSESNVSVQNVEAVASTQVNVDWTSEIKSLLDTLASGCDLIRNLNSSISDFKLSDKNKIIELMFKIFHGETEAQTNQTIAAYEAIETQLTQSKIVDKVLSMSFINKAFIGALTSTYPSVYVPENIRFYDVDGDPGELSCFLGAIKYILKNEANKPIILNLLSQSSSQTEMLTDLRDLCINLQIEDDNHKTAADYLAESDILRVVLSSFIFANKNIGSLGELYIPNSALEVVDGQTKELLKSVEIEDLLDLLPQVLTPILDYLSAPEADRDIDALLVGIRNLGDEILANKIIEGTISNVVRNFLSKTDYIKIPSYLSTTEDWLSTEGNPGEFRRMMSAKDATGLKITALINNGFSGTITDIIGSLNDTMPGTTKKRIEVICDSGVMYLTLSSYLDTVLTDSLVDPNAKTAVKVTYQNDVYYGMEEIEALINVINSLELNITSIDISSITANLSTLNTIPTDGTETKLDTLYKSVIAKSMLYKNLNNIITSNGLLVDSNEAKETTGGITIYKKEEISSLVTFIGSLGENFNISEISIDSITLSDSAINSVGSSYILTGSISANLVDKDILAIPASDYDTTNEHIKNDSLKGLLFSVRDGLSITNISTFDASAIKLPSSNEKVDALLESSIMQATISSKISAGAGNSVYVSRDEAYSTVGTLYDDSEAIIVTKNELKAFISGISILSADGGYEVTISNEKLKELQASGDIAKALDSNILYIIISNYIMESGYPIDASNKENMNVYNVGTKEEVTIEVVTKEAINAVIALM